MGELKPLRKLYIIQIHSSFGYLKYRFKPSQLKCRIVLSLLILTGVYHLNQRYDLEVFIRRIVLLFSNSNLVSNYFIDSSFMVVNSEIYKNRVKVKESTTLSEQDFHYFFGSTVTTNSSILSDEDWEAGLLKNYFEHSNSNLFFWIEDFYKDLAIDKLKQPFFKSEFSIEDRFNSALVSKSILKYIPVHDLDFIELKVSEREESNC